jgi:hypothetical protein
MSKKNCITYEQLIANFLYVSETGKFYKKIGGNLVEKGNYGQYKYGEICLNNTSYFAHRMAWLYFYKEMPNGHIDHINGLKGDNRICNLRLADDSLNMQNVIKATSKSKSGIRGVSFDSRRNKWLCQISIKGRRINIGRFCTKEQAAEEYLKAKKMYHSAPILQFLEN